MRAIELKYDAIIILLLFPFRLAYLLLTLVLKLFARFYDYWFSFNSSVGDDTLDYIKFILGNFVCLVLDLFHCLVTLIFWFI